jgi:hypothetical protein
MDADFFPIKYQIEEFGLTPRECELLISFRNGLSRNPGVLPSGAYLAAELSAEASNVVEDQEQFGRSLAFVPDDTAELPYEVHDLVEKLGRLEPWQAAAIEYFIYGFWAGVQQGRGEE